jgi:hypothetical protein
VTDDARFTGEVLAWLRARRGSRRVAVRRIAFAVYLAALFSAIYGWPVVLWAVRSLETEHVRGKVGVAVIPALPLGLSCLFVIVLVGACRNALWHGPVVLSGPDVAWLLPTPLDRVRLLRPRAVNAIGAAGIGGALAGALGALLVNAVHPHGGGRLVAGMIGFGCATAVIAVAAAAVVEASPRAARGVRRFWLSGLGLSLVLAVLTTVRASGRSWIWVNRIVVWSGPWGWTSQLPVAVDRGSDAATFTALVLVLLLATLLVAVAFRSLAGFTADSLRARARLEGRVVGDLFVGDARSARLEIQQARAANITNRLRIRVPRSRLLVIAWRDLIALVRAPGRIAWSAFFVTVAALMVGVGVAVSSTHDPAPAAIAIAVLCGYWAATALLEVGRIDNDRPDVTAQLPLRFSTIARRHIVVPSAVLAALGAIAGAIVGARFGASAVACAIAAIAAAPVLVGAASVNVYRKATPVQWLGVDPYGFGFTFVILWMLVGPILSLVALVPAAVQIFSALRDGSAPGAAISDFATICVLAVAVEVFIVTRRSGGRARAVR